MYISTPTIHPPPRFPRQPIRSYGSPSWSPAHTINPFLSMPGSIKRKGYHGDANAHKSHTIGGLPSFYRFGRNPSTGTVSSGLESGYQSRASGKSGQSGDSLGATRSESGDPESTGAPQSSEGGVETEEEGGEVAEMPTGGVNEGETATTSVADVRKKNVQPATPLLVDRMLHDEEDEEEEMVFEVWVASASSHCSVATVIEYCGQFISIEVCTL